MSNKKKAIRKTAEQMMGRKLTEDEEVTQSEVDSYGEADVEGASIKENAERRKGNLKKGYPYRDNTEIDESVLPDPVKEVMRRTPKIRRALKDGSLPTNFLKVSSVSLKKINDAISKLISGKTEIVEEDISRPEVNNENAKNRFRESKAVQEIGESGRKER
jgi:hypothetical protein